MPNDTSPAVLTEAKTNDLLDRLAAHDIPVNALGRVLGISGSSAQRFLSGRYRMPVALAQVLEGVIAFRTAKDPE